MKDMTNGSVHQDFFLIADTLSVYKSAVVSDRCGDTVTTRSANSYWTFAVAQSRSFPSLS